MNNRLHTTVILAMTVDGKIADYQSSAARFGSANDRTHLEQQISLADGVLFGAGTLRAYGTTMSVSQRQLLQVRKARSQSPQPIQIVVSASADLDPQWRFFQQPIPRWLITIPKNEGKWQNRNEFERILIAPEDNSFINWTTIFQQLAELGLNKLAILGGGELIASLLAENLIDELWLTLCPVIFGGNAPTPVGGTGFMQSQGKKLQLLEVKQIDQELFLHYLVASSRADNS
ncbi:MAG: RibD family protein [Hyellaceae cyanobacterium CSU_1_1]|nr:RibD family protein [Hyellaceae cyanobacterium CSU_1_1]